MVHIPVTDMEPPTFEAVERFIDIANDVTCRPMFVHCKAGIGRTGTMVSCWRISQGMDVDEAGPIVYCPFTPPAAFNATRRLCTLVCFVFLRSFTTGKSQPRVFTSAFLPPCLYLRVFTSVSLPPCLYLSVFTSVTRPLLTSIEYVCMCVCVCVDVNGMDGTGDAEAPCDEALALESLCCDFGSIAQEAFVRSFAERHARKKREAERASKGDFDEGDDLGKDEGLAWVAAAAASAPAKKSFVTEEAAAASATTTSTSSASFGVKKVDNVMVVAAEAEVTDTGSGDSGDEGDAVLDIPTVAGSFYDGAGFHEDDPTLYPTNRISSLLESPDGTGSGIPPEKEKVAAVGEHSSLENAPDMYVIRTDGFTCSREEVEERMLKISHPSTQQLVLVWRKPPKRILILKKLGFALLPQLVEVCHAMMSMGFHVVVEEGVVEEMREAVRRETVRPKSRARSPRCRAPSTPTLRKGRRSETRCCLK